MVAPVIAAGARAAAQGAAAQKAAQAAGEQTTEKPKPSFLDPGPMIMQLLAAACDLLCILPIISFLGSTIGLIIDEWLSRTTGSSPMGKIGKSLLFKNIPIIQIWPRYTIAVWNACDHSM